MDCYCSKKRFYIHIYLCIHHCNIKIIDDSKNTGSSKGVPASFPGTILIQRKNGKYILHEEYRKYNDDALNEDFEYFLRQILSVSNPSINKFKESKQKLLISDMFTIADEAFGLLILYNEFHVWKLQVDQIKSGVKVKRERKRFCDGKSGNKQGWTSEGIKCYHSLCIQVKKRRDETKTVEENMRDIWAKEAKNDDTHTGTSEDEDVDSIISNDNFFCEDQGMIEDLDKSDDDQ